MSGGRGTASGVQAPASTVAAAPTSAALSPPARPATDDSPDSTPRTLSRREQRMSVVDNAIYIDGNRAVVPDSLDQTFEALHACPSGGHSFAWIGMLRPDEAGDPGGREGVRPAPPRGRGHDQRPSAPEAGAVRRRAVRGAAARPLRRPRGRRRDRRGPPVPRARLRHHGAARRGARPRRGAHAVGGRPGAVAPRVERRPLRGAGQGRRRLRPRAGRAAERHRRDRGAGLRRRPAGLPAHLPAVPRGDRLPACGRPARRPPRRPARRAQTTGRGHRPRAAAQPARRGRPRHPGDRAAGRVPRAAHEHPAGQRGPRRRSGRTRRWPA